MTNRANVKRWRQANPDKVAVHSANDYARRHAAPGNLTTAEWETLVAVFDGRCAYCLALVPLTVDHMTPTSRGGRHDIENVVPACVRCNSRKGPKTLLEFATYLTLEAA